MAIERTYTKRGDKIYLKEIEMREATDGTMFKIVDRETEYNHKKHLPQIADKLTELQEEIADLQKDETVLITTIAAIKAARDGR